MLVSPHVGFLHHIFGFVAVAEYATRHAIQPLVMAPHDDLVELDFTRANTRNHFFIRDRGPWPALEKYCLLPDQRNTSPQLLSHETGKGSQDLFNSRFANVRKRGDSVRVTTAMFFDLASAILRWPSTRSVMEVQFQGDVKYENTRDRILRVRGTAACGRYLERCATGRFQLFGQGQSHAGSAYPAMRAQLRQERLRRAGRRIVFEV